MDIGATVAENDPFLCGQRKNLGAQGRIGPDNRGQPTIVAGGIGQQGQQFGGHLRQRR